MLDLLDVDAFSAYFFFGAEPREEFNYDLNDDGFPDAVDLNILIDYIYFEGEIPNCGNASQSPEFIDFNPPLEAFVDELYIYDAEAYDPEGDALTFSLVSAPPGMEIIGMTGFVFWQPSISQASNTPYQVTIAVSDSTHSVTKTFELKVNFPPVPPATSPAPLQSNEDNQIELAPGSIDPFPGEPESQSTSTHTSTSEGDAQSGRRNLASLLFAGVFNFFGNLGDWLLDHPFLFGILILLLLLILFLLWKRGRDEEKNPSLWARLINSKQC